MAVIRNYNTLAEFNSEPIHPENKICFIKDKAILYSNGVQYSPSKMELISNMGDSDNPVDKFNELRTNLLKSNLMEKKNLLYWTGDNTISIAGTTYTAEPNKINIDGVEYHQLIMDDNFNDNFYKFDKNTFTNLIFKDVDTSKIICIEQMFEGCTGLKSLDVSGFDTSNVTSMMKMFNGCNALTSLDLSGWDTSKVTDIRGMFQNCNAIISLDLSGWDTTNVTNMGWMFNFCDALTELDVSNFDTSKVTNMTCMFQKCLALKSLDLSGWDTSKVTNMIEMFKGCNALKTIRMVGCSQTTIDKIKAQLTTDGITDCAIVTE